MDVFIFYCGISNFHTFTAENHVHSLFCIFRGSRSRHRLTRSSVPSHRVEIEVSVGSSISLKTQDRWHDSVPCSRRMEVSLPCLLLTRDSFQLLGNSFCSLVHGLLHHIAAYSFKNSRRISFPSNLSDILGSPDEVRPTQDNLPFDELEVICLGM